MPEACEIRYEDAKWCRDALGRLMGWSVVVLLACAGWLVGRDNTNNLDDDVAWGLLLGGVFFTISWSLALLLIYRAMKKAALSGMMYPRGPWVQAYWAGACLIASLIVLLAVREEIGLRCASIVWFGSFILAGISFLAWDAQEKRK